MNAPIVCPQCSTPIPVALFNSPALTPCPTCRAPIRAWVFPSIAKTEQQTVAPSRITDAGQAACFYHPTKTAHVPCDACGRFICALCDVELHGQHLCPSCIESGRRKGALTTFENSRILWDNIALNTAILPAISLFGMGFVVVTAPAAILLAVIGWRKPRSLAPRWTVLRLVLAILISLAEIVGVVAFFYFVSSTGALIQQ